jgi:hypothetical protein
MEAYLELQKQIYQLVAYAKTGIADTKQLNELDRHQLSISVKVSEGSSDLSADLRQSITRLLSILATKMSSRQAVIVVLGMTLILSGAWCFSAWLEQQKLLRLEELKSKEHIQALEGLSFANQAQVEQLQHVLVVLKEQGEIGARTAAAAQATYEAMLRAAARTERSKINGQEVTREEAESLRVSPKKKSSVRYVTQRMRVVDINTAEPTEVLTLMDEDRNQYKMPFPTNLFAQNDRKDLFKALDAHENLWVELMVRELGDEIRSMTFLRIRHDVSESED